MMMELTYAVTTENKRKYLYILKEKIEFETVEDTPNLYYESNKEVPTEFRYSGSIFYIGTYKKLPIYLIPWMKAQDTIEISETLRKIVDASDERAQQYFVLNDNSMYDGRFNKIGTYDGVYVNLD
jgi:hypothetical protein